MATQPKRTLIPLASRRLRSVRSMARRGKLLRPAERSTPAAGAHAVALARKRREQNGDRHRPDGPPDLKDWEEKNGRDTSVEARAKRESRKKQRYALTMPQLPKGCDRIDSGARRFRNELEIAVIEAHGAITLTSAAAIDTAVAFEKMSRYLYRRMREKEDSMTNECLLHYIKEATTARERRNKAIAVLKIDVLREEDPMEDVFSVGGDDDWDPDSEPVE